jgi:hypothetical protein
MHRGSLRGRLCYASPLPAVARSRAAALGPLAPHAALLAALAQECLRHCAAESSLALQMGGRFGLGTVRVVSLTAVAPSRSGLLCLWLAAMQAQQVRWERV